MCQCGLCRWQSNAAALYVGEAERVTIFVAIVAGANLPRVFHVFHVDLTVTATLRPKNLALS